MALQMDIIPAPEKPYNTILAEDGILVMNETLQNQMQKKFPDAWHSLADKKKFMREKLGITLKPEVFPVSNIPGILRPFIFDRRRAMTLR